jgi:hypothetical protein
MSTVSRLSQVNHDEFCRLAADQSDHELAERYNCSVVTIGRWRTRLGIPRSDARPWSRTQGRHPWLRTDDTFFAQIDTPAKAYILGFLIADGHVYKTGNRVELSVKEADAPILQKILDAMGRDVRLRVNVNSYNKSRSIRVTLGGTQMSEQLARIGLRHDKSMTATYPEVPPELEDHLARGLWDGDGYIGERVFELTGTSALLDGVVDAAERHTGCSLRRRMSGKDSRYHYAYGTRRDTAILHWMYSSADLVLERKRERFLTYWSEIPSAESLNLRIGRRVYTRKSQVRSAADYPSAD